MSTLRFTKPQLIEALEARRPWAERLDAEKLRDHQEAEREFLQRFRQSCREAVKWDYATAKKHGFSLRLRTFDRPQCPRSLVVLLNNHLATVQATRQERFVVTENGTWAKVFYLLTHDENAKAEMY